MRYSIASASSHECFPSKIRIIILKHSLVANEPFDLAAPTKLLPLGPSWQKFQSMRDDTLHVPRLNKTIRNEAAEIFYGASNTQHLRKLTANLGFARAPCEDTTRPVYKEDSNETDDEETDDEETDDEETDDEETDDEETDDEETDDEDTDDEAFEKK
ncbi:hypothetical protein UCDDS831_g04822 [Diplodia seriata]|uniref:Uncharacterized protein n=1 Tax=Diplodia seriata TaxID=420778 RepID=A0A0G2G9K5_9PEZI|nr:hypothetical protein UCDDS831_g04822 [Diplodia seriata]